MPEPLEKECRAYTQYLIGQEPSGYVLAKYFEYHRTTPLAAADAFDRLLLRISAQGPFWARVADTYASRFHKPSALRKKLVLLLALLECSPPSSQYLDTPPPGGALSAVLRLAFQAFAYALTLALAAAALLPLHLALAAAGRRR